MGRQLDARVKRLELAVSNSARPKDVILVHVNGTTGRLLPFMVAGRPLMQNHGESDEAYTRRALELAPIVRGVRTLCPWPFECPADPTEVL